MRHASQRSKITKFPLSAQFVKDSKFLVFKFCQFGSLQSSFGFENSFTRSYNFICSRECEKRCNIFFRPQKIVALIYLVFCSRECKIRRDIFFRPLKFSIFRVYGNIPGRGLGSESSLRPWEKRRKHQITVKRIVNCQTVSICNTLHSSIVHLTAQIQRSRTFYKTAGSHDSLRSYGTGEYFPGHKEKHGND